MRVRKLLFNQRGIEVECQDAVSTAAVRRSRARAALAGKGELRQQVWWTPEITVRPISCLKRRIQIIKDNLFAPFVGNAVFGDVFVHSNAGFDWQEQTIVPMICNGNHAIDAELCPGAGVASLVKQHKLRIGHSRGRQSSAIRSTTFTQQSQSVLAELSGYGSVRAEGDSVVYSISMSELEDLTGDPQIRTGRC